MLTTQRKQLILERLRQDGQIVAKALSEELGISEDTVRRDLRELAAEGQLQRVHGGALPASAAQLTVELDHTRKTWETADLLKHPDAQTVQVVDDDQAVRHLGRFERVDQLDREADAAAGVARAGHQRLGRGAPALAREQFDVADDLDAAAAGKAHQNRQAGRGRRGKVSWQPQRMGRSKQKAPLQRKQQRRDNQ